jgi:hypothetical protein
LIFGESKEEIPIYIFTKVISFLSPFAWELVPSGSLESLGVVVVDYSRLFGVSASVEFLGASN